MKYMLAIKLISSDLRRLVCVSCSSYILLMSLRYNYLEDTMINWHQ